MADVKISQIAGGAISVANRSSGDLFEIEQSSGQSKYASRQNGITYLESSLITLTSANYLLNSTPLTVQAATANALQVLIPSKLIMYLDYGGTAFDFPASGIDLVFSTATGTPIINIPQTAINATADQVTVFHFETPLDTDMVFQDDLVLFASANPTQGNSSVYFRLIYSVQDFNP